MFRRFSKKTDDKIGLVLPGGGARGAYQVGVLKAISEFMEDEKSPFNVVTGTSVGSINALSIASHPTKFKISMKRTEKLWTSLHAGKVYKTGFMQTLKAVMHWLMALTFTGLGRNNPVALLDYTPLENLLKKELNMQRLSDSIQNGSFHAVGVSLSSYARGTAVTFFEGHPDIEEWERTRREGRRKNITVEDLMASAALPFVFPPKKIDGEYFGDGSLRLNAPLSPAIHLGADRIMVIGIRDKVIDESPDKSAPKGAPSLGYLAGYMLDIAFSDNLDADIERLSRINDTLSLMSEKQKSQTSLKPIEILCIDPSEDIREIAGRHAGELPWSVRMLIKGLDAWGGDWRLPSYLLFEPGFIKDLIDLGYRDAMSQQDQIEKFLS